MKGNGMLAGTKIFFFVEIHVCFSSPVVQEERNKRTEVCSIWQVYGGLAFLFNKPIYGHYNKILRYIGFSAPSL
jgi:hypothetical protein